MSTRTSILSKTRWQPLLDKPGLIDLSTSVLFAADDFFDFATEKRIVSPTPEHFANWAIRAPEKSRMVELEKLADAMNIIAPNLVGHIHDAATLLDRAQPEEAQSSGTASEPEASANTRSQSDFSRQTATSWDPIAPPSRRAPRARSVSLEPSELPEAWKETLRRMARGLSKGGVRAPSHEVIKRMREKLCQFSWAAQKHGLNIEITQQTVDIFDQELTERCRQGKNGLRWATIRASYEELHRFARYRSTTEDAIEYLATRLRMVEHFESGQKALKFFELARTGNTTLKILDLADDLLTASKHLNTPRRRHEGRNQAAILGIYSVAPLRNASAKLVFGKSLYWDHDLWVIDTMISKTRARRPERFVFPLEPEYGKFIDALLLGDQPQRRLPFERQKALSNQRPLFVHHGGRPKADSYISRKFKEVTDNSFTTLRTMLHTDLGVEHGEHGTLMAMIATHQNSAKTAEKYKMDSVGIAASLRCQLRARRRRERVQYGPLEEEGKKRN
ncbi:hypothetical protein FIU89_15455 [Roseovarius sp. THAF27]|uniref:hypothetical protein n=1 Tax=Roseovarius sp. THAF27 TaxID=2587850 RepID=UPI0012691562|nr:hypothetical protein [Roseovarius sp. THAF27]QFT82021.1 hypothetical protein FIU89_15455 [Roseovarius sp. THAF27]